MERAAWWAASVNAGHGSVPRPWSADNFCRTTQSFQSSERPFSFAKWAKSKPSSFHVVLHQRGEKHSVLSLLPVWLTVALQCLLKNFVSSFGNLNMAQFIHYRRFLIKYMYKKRIDAFANEPSVHFMLATSLFSLISWIIEKGDAGSSSRLQSASLNVAYLKKNAAPDGRPEAEQPRGRPGKCSPAALPLWDFSRHSFMFWIFYTYSAIFARCEANGSRRLTPATPPEKSQALHYSI